MHKLLWSLAKRSGYIKAQLECLGEEGVKGGLELPAELGTLWLECVFLSPSDLLQTANAKLKEYLKLCS